MDKSTAEELDLEPLFDYSRVQPLNFISLDDDDLSDSDKPVVISPKRMKKSQPENCNDVKPIICDDKDEEDWLPSPPKKTSSGARKSELEGSTIKELRLKKQELASLTQSAEDVVRAVEESVRKEVASSLQSSLGSEAEKVSKPPEDRAKIIISIQDKEELKQFRVYMDEKFEKIFKMYAEKVNRDIRSLVFSFDGDKVSATETPGGLGMEDNDIIEVHTKKS